MASKKVYALSLIILILIIVYIVKKEFFPNKNLETNEDLSVIDNSYSSNLIKEVNYNMNTCTNLSVFTYYDFIDRNNS